MLRPILWRLAFVPACLLLAAALDPGVPVARPNAPGWTQRHIEKLEELRHGPIDLVFLGDSITQELENTNAAWGNLNGVWQRFYACRHAINLGFNGDTTASVLWRIQNGEVAGIAPKLVVVMVGTNNIRPTVESTASGVTANIVYLVAELHRRLPASRILLLGIPPSSRTGATEQERLDVNASLAARDWSAQNATFKGIDDAFFSAGALDMSLFRVGMVGRAAVHPNAEGWRRLAEAIEPAVSRLLGEAPHPVRNGKVCASG